MTALAAAVEALAGRLSHVSVTLLLLGVVLHVCNLLLRSAAWRAALVAAMPGACVRRRSVTGAYLAGAGVNAVVPARGGDVVKVVLAARSIPGACTASVASSLLVETLVDAVVGTVLIGWAVWSGALPLRRLSPPTLDARLMTVAAIAVLVLATVAVVRSRGQIDRLTHGLARGLAILGCPRAYLLRVAAPQAVGWGFRVLSMMCLLQAFHIAGGIDAAVLALVAGSVASLVPVTPGGVGAQQALLALLLAPFASPAAAISFGLGSQLVMTVVNVALGGTCMGLMLGTLPWRMQAQLAREDAVAAPLPVAVALQPGE